MNNSSTDGKVMMVKTRSVGVSTIPAISSGIHFIKGYDLLDSFDFDNFEELSMVFESGMNDWYTGFSKEKPFYPGYRMGGYIRAISKNIENRLVLHIDPDGKKSFLMNIEHMISKNKSNHYISISFDELMDRLADTERDNLFYFLNHGA
jgi:hypothetical protein